MATILQALIIRQNKESNNLIKAVCCYKRCKVIVTDNLHELNIAETIAIYRFKLGRTKDFAQNRKRRLSLPVSNFDTGNNG